MHIGADPDNIKGTRGVHLELRQGRQNRENWEDPTKLVQSVFIGFLCVQRTLSIFLLEEQQHAPRKILKIRFNEIEFEMNLN